MRWLLLLVLLLTLPVVTNAQGSRTAERLVDAPFSQLTTAYPNGSVRHCTNCQATTPCTSGGTGAQAMRIGGTWRCSVLDDSGGGGSSGAPIAATYVTMTPHSTLTNEFPLSTLGNGILKHTGGTPSVAVAGTDYLTPSGSGAGLTSLNASQLLTGIVPDAAFPATLPVASGLNLTNLNASNLASGVVAKTRGGFGADVSAADGVPFFTTGTIAFTATTGTSTFVRRSSPTIDTPFISSFVNAGHTHTNAAGGGQLTDAALSAAVGIAKGGHGQTTQTAGFDALSPLTTKGDVIGHNGTNNTRLAVGTNGQCLKAASGQVIGLEWGTCGAGTGDVVGPASAVDNTIARYDSTTGKLIQASSVTIDDSNNISTAGAISTGVGGSDAGTVDLGEGTALTLVANTFSLYAPVDVAAGGLALVFPGAAFTGLPKWTNTAGVMVISQATAGTDYSTPSSTDTQTNKSLNLANNTVTGTTAQFNTALSDNDFATLAGSETLTNKTLTTPVLGAATATSINGLTITSSTGTLTVANGKTATVSNTLAFTGTDSSSVAFGAGGTVTYTIASGTAALGTSAIASGASATVVTVSATGVATTDVISWGFNGSPIAVTGYVPSANGMLTIIAYPSANNVNFVVTNNTASSITPGAITLNFRVVR